MWSRFRPSHLEPWWFGICHCSGQRRSWIRLDWICLTTTRPTEHISRPTQVGSLTVYNLWQFKSDRRIQLLVKIALCKSQESSQRGYSKSQQCSIHPEFPAELRIPRACGQWSTSVRVDYNIMSHWLHVLIIVQCQSDGCSLSSKIVLLPGSLLDKQLQVISPFWKWRLMTAAAPTLSHKMCTLTKSDTSIGLVRISATCMQG